MNKLNVLLAACLALAVSCKQKDANTPESGTVKISGSIQGVDTGYFEMILPSRENEKVDSIKITKGEFEHSFEVKEPELVLMRLANTPGAELVFFADPGKVKITAYKDSMQATKVEAGENQALLKEAEVKVKELMEKGQGMFPAYQQAQMNNDSVALRKIEAEMMELQAGAREYAVAFAGKHRNSPMAAYLGLIYLNDPSVGPAQLKTVYDTLTVGARKTYFGKKMAELIEATSATSVGAVAPDFTMNDLNGNPVSLASFKGKYVLLDFWASWCKPCRVENPAVVKAYNEFKDKNFTILAVSLDDNKDAWAQAVKDDNLRWTHVSDLSQGNNAAARLYKVNSIPANFLLDPTGKIIAKDLRGEELAKALKTYVK